ncbi:MAG: hypothetical protein NTW20_07330 [Rhodobacterales bacterium]|nr:hypothetical protein [Rhodobacterales bacterium]
MTFNLFLVLFTLAALVVGWVMHKVFDETDDGPAYWETVLFPGRHHPPPSYRWPFVIVFLIIGGIGAYTLP